MDSPPGLEQRLERVEDLLARLLFTAQLRADEPYEAALLRLGLIGEERTLVDLVINAVLGRAEGEPMAGQRPRRDVLDAAVLDRAYVDAGIDRAEAIALLAEITGSPESAAEVLDAHRARGLGRRGHAALG